MQEPARGGGTIEDIDVSLYMASQKLACTRPSIKVEYDTRTVAGGKLEVPYLPDAQQLIDACRGGVDPHLFLSRLVPAIVGGVTVQRTPSLQLLCRTWWRSNYDGAALPLYPPPILAVGARVTFERAVAPTRRGDARTEAVRAQVVAAVGLLIC